MTRCFRLNSPDSYCLLLGPRAQATGSHYAGHRGFRALGTKLLTGRELAVAGEDQPIQELPRGRAAEAASSSR